MTDKILAAYQARPKDWILKWGVFLGIVLIVYLSLPYIPFKGLTSYGQVIARSIITGILSPDLSYFTDLSTQGIPYLLLETIAIAFLGTLVGAILSLPFAFLSSRNLEIGRAHV